MAISNTPGPIAQLWPIYTQCTCVYANQVARAIVRMDDRQYKIFLNAMRSIHIPLRSTYWAPLM